MLRFANGGVNRIVYRLGWAGPPHFSKNGSAAGSDLHKQRSTGSGRRRAGGNSRWVLLTISGKIAEGLLFAHFLRDQRV